VAGYAPGGAAARHRQGAGWPGGDGSGPGQAERAGRLFGAAARLLPATSSSREEVNRRSDAARAHLDAATFEAGWTAGQAMTEEQAVTLALLDS